MVRKASIKVSALLLALTLLTPLGAQAQSALLGRILPDGRIAFERVEDLVIDGNRKVKLAAESLTRVEPSDAKSLERIELNRAGLVRGDGKGRIYRVNGNGSTDRIIPENFPLKMSIQPKTAQIPLEVSALKDRKSKEGEAIDAKSFYFYQADPDPDRAALRFLLTPRNFADVAEQLRAMEGFATSLPNSPAVPDLKRNLAKRLTAAAEAFDTGGPYPALVEAQTIAVSSRKAFPSDEDVKRRAEAIDQRVQATLGTERKLVGLAGIEDWGTYLSVYRDIEMNSDSFPQLQSLHHIALEERTRELCLRARALIARRQDGAALEEFASAAKLDPENDEIPKLIDITRIDAAKQQAERGQEAATLRRLAKDSPEERQFRQAIYNANRAIQDHDWTAAEDSLKKAEQEDSGAPEILLARASLMSGTGNMMEAIPLLDRYDTLVSDSASREKGDTVRNQVQYELRKQRQTSKQNIDSALSQGDFPALYQAASGGLKFDPDNAAFLYSAGVSAAALRKAADAKRYLDSYLVISDSLAANENERKKTREILRLTEPVSAGEGSGRANWFSGRKLGEGIYYCPTSLAFQTPFDGVAGFKFRMAFQWTSGRLLSIRSDFEDEKGREDYHGLVARAPHSAQTDEGGSFTFVYDDMRTAVRAVYAGAAPKGKAETAGFRFVTASDKSIKMVDTSGQPLILLPDNPRVNLNVITRLMGPAATIVSGNSFFNPFVWDAVHYFTATYDAQGRVMAAKEWDVDNLVKFTWDGDRLLEITAFHGQEHEPYYKRTISYAGRHISSEEYESGAHGGRITYKYSKNDIVSAKIDDGGVHDGKTWLVHFSE